MLENIRWKKKIVCPDSLCQVGVVVVKLSETLIVIGDELTAAFNS